MAWLQSSFTNHHLLGDSGSNDSRKGYKSAVKKNSDPDKSDTPLLPGLTHTTPTKTSIETDWFENISSVSTKKQGRSGFLSSNLFDRSSSSSKAKSVTVARASNPEQLKRATEDKKLLNSGNRGTDFNAQEDEEDSDDEWGTFSSDGYQKIKTCVD